MTCCTSFLGDLARDHASQLAAVARHEGLSPTDALDAVQEAFQTLLAIDAPSDDILERTRVTTCMAKLGDVHRHVITPRRTHAVAHR